MSSRDQESAFTSVYTSAAFSGVYDSTVKRILNDSLYVYKSYSGISFGKLEMHLKEKVVENGDNAVLETYYDGLPTDILYTSSTLQERVAVVYEEETLPLMDAFILEGDAGGTLAAALEKVAGMSPGMFAMGWANISPADAVDINLIMLPVMEKEKFFLAEHHLYGSSRLGIKKYWPNQYLFEWDKSQTTSWNGTQFENVELASHRPWYSQAHNQMISTYATVPWGNAHNDKMSSERVLGLKQYELTNHLGNVMSVVLDKVTESPKANATTFPAEVDKRASLSAAYDYYPFGMLMPGRYAEDESVQCTHITKTRYESQMLQVVDLPLAQTADLAVFSPNQLTQLSIVNSTTGSYMKAEKLSSANGNTEFFTIFNAQSINQEVKIVTNISNLGTNALTVSLYQQDGNADWQLLDNQTLASTSELNLTGTTTSMNPLKVVWSSYNGTFKVSGVKYIVKDLYAVSYQEEICNTDDDFKDDYRFGFNGQHKDNEIAGIGNHNTALFWEYDTRLGRRWNIDPVDQVSISNYATFGNNPIFYSDVLGNTYRVHYEETTKDKSGKESTKQKYIDIHKPEDLATASEKSGNNSFVNDYVQTTLKEMETGSDHGINKELIESEEIVNVREATGSEGSKFHGKGDNIVPWYKEGGQYKSNELRWNRNSGLIYQNKKGGKVLSGSPALLVLHEKGHAFLHIFGANDAKLSLLGDPATIKVKLLAGGEEQLVTQTFEQSLTASYLGGGLNARKLYSSGHQMLFNTGNIFSKEPQGGQQAATEYMKTNGLFKK
ncbi:MAG TPA: hypothetical protein PKC41_03985 [Chitinophagaceae bacterium]|nr:hypothetical protein [Chitinophagaceae bacterium]